LQVNHVAIVALQCVVDNGAQALEHLQLAGGAELRDKVAVLLGSTSALSFFSLVTSNV
jgi:hypothetical protein